MRFDEIYHCLTKVICKHIFNRNPGWVLYKAQKSFSPNTRKTLEKNEWLRKLLRNYLFLYYESIYPLLKKDSSFTSFGMIQKYHVVQQNFTNYKIATFQEHGCVHTIYENNFQIVLIFGPN